MLFVKNRPRQIKKFYSSRFTTNNDDLNKNDNKSFDFHKADYGKINDYWDDLFQNRNANDCWLKFLEIAKEAIELYVSIRGQKNSTSLDDEKYFENYEVQKCFKVKIS